MRRQMPVIGRIAAGTPIEAIQHAQHTSRCRRDAARRAASTTRSRCGRLDDRGRHHRRRHRGHPGAADAAKNGDIVVALVEDEEATLKRLRRRGTTIALEAANPAYETRIYRPDQVKVQGKLVGLIRTY